MREGTDRDRRLDVVVIGGGPAGAAAARLLAAWGHSVLVLTKPEGAAPALAESLPPSCVKLFGPIGIRAAIDAAGFYPTRGNTVWWGEQARRSEDFEGETTGYQVVRREFDRVLLGEAEHAGAIVRRGVTARQVDLPPEPGSTDPAPVRVTYEDVEGHRGTVDARTTLDCSGRAGVIARRYRTRDTARRSTVALVGVWRRDGGWDLPDDSHTVVETYADGWAWSVPISPECRYITVMIDPRTTHLDKAGSLTNTYRTELRKTTQINRLVEDARLDGEPFARDASLYGARVFGGPGFLLVGDAATFIDPLSSFGVKKALASAWLAAIATHTRLRRPEREELVLRLFTTREREAYDSYRQQSATYFGEVSRFNPHPFWSDRADPLDPDLQIVDDEVRRLREDPDVLAAFEALKRAPSIRLRPTARLRTTLEPAVEGREIVAERRLVIPDVPGSGRGLRFVRGVDLPQLVSMVDAHDQVPDLFEAYQRVRPPVGLPDFLGALSVLLGKGLLRNDRAS